MSASLTQTKRLPQIVPLTGIRGFAAWWVVSFHIAYLLPSLPAAIYWFARIGFLGVDLFFVLSGFIISYNYWGRFSPFSMKVYRRFLWARLARLYPVHLFTLMLSAILLLALWISGLGVLKNFSTWTAGTFLANLFLVHAWRPHSVESWNNASWSVSCEWFAYILFPLLVLCRLHKLRSFIAILLAALLSAIPAAFVQSLHIPSFFLLIKVICEFTAGCLMFHVYDVNRSSPRIRRIVALCIGFTFIVATVLLHGLRYIAPDWLALIFPLVILTLAESTGTLARIVDSRAAVYWGKVSYSLYMTHNVTLWILKARVPAPQGGAGILLFSVYFASIAVIAILTYHFVEEPCRAWMRTWNGRTRIPAVSAENKKKRSLQ